MKGLIFEGAAPVRQPTPNRSDVVCFIGYAHIKDGDPPQELQDWLEREGWWSTPVTTGIQAGGKSLYDLPLPIHNWEQFDHLFQWTRRFFDPSQAEGATYLGAAVRSFFAQGGRKCFVISMGEPVDYFADRDVRDGCLLKLVPEYSGQRGRRSQWHGLHHLFGLPEVSFVSLPDLAELASASAAPELTSVPISPSEPQFLECSQPPQRQEQSQLTHLDAPRCSDVEYGIWGSVLHRACRWLSDFRREVQLLASLPLPRMGSKAAKRPLAFMHEQGWLSFTLQSPESLATAFLQLSYPWLGQGYSGDLPAGLEPPEGVLAGMLARNCLTRGGFRSAAGLDVHNLVDMRPRLSAADQLGINPGALSQASPQSPLIDRVSLFGWAPAGPRLLSDVTTSNDSSYRQGCINRTIALVMRAAQIIGQDVVFQASGERLWTQIEKRLGDVLAAMQKLGALAGQRPQEAFQVRCDRSTMTQQDMDSGRVVVLVDIRPAASIETMRIHLSLSDSGRVSLTALGQEAA